MEITLRVCDVCQNPSLTATTYKVVAADKERERIGTTDRCPEHAEELERIIGSTRQASGPASARKSDGKRSPRRSSTRRVVTMAEIEQLKKER